MRNRLIHGYLGIDNDTLWSIIRSGIPALLPHPLALRECHDRANDYMPELQNENQTHRIAGGTADRGHLQAVRATTGAERQRLPRANRRERREFQLQDELKYANHIYLK